MSLDTSLRALDVRFAGWAPGWPGTAAPLVEQALALAESRPTAALPARLCATLPSSVARRAQLVLGFAPHTVFIDGDVDGLAALLAERCSVHVVNDEGPAALDAWLHQACAGAKHAALFEAPAANSVDLTVLEAPASDSLPSRLARAIGVTKPEGLLVLRIHAPDDTHAHHLIAHAGLEVVRYLREIDHRWLQHPFALDGAGDLLVLRRTAKTRMDASFAPPLSTQQHQAWDLDGLGPAASGPQALDELAQRIQCARGVEPLLRQLLIESDRHTLTYVEPTGATVILELRPGQRHVLAVFLPHDRSLEVAVLNELVSAFAGPHTRARPQRTGRIGPRTVFG